MNVPATTSGIEYWPFASTRPALPAFSPSMIWASACATIGRPVLSSVMMPANVRVTTAAATLTCCDPRTPEYVAVISASPAAMLRTTPALDTVATAASDDCQVACAVTSCVVPLDSVAVAANWLVSPTAGEFPLTAIELTVAVGATGVEGVEEEEEGFPPHP